MKTLMNPARILCPELSRSGKCNSSGCPYSHVNVTKVVSTPEVSSSSVSTGRNGQYTGTSKGANAVPIAIQGGLPSFLQKFTGSSTPKVTTVASGFSAPPSVSSRTHDYTPEYSRPSSAAPPSPYIRSCPRVSGSEFSKLPMQPVRAAESVTDWRHAIKKQPPQESLSLLLEEKEARVLEISELDDEIRQLAMKLNIAGGDAQSLQLVSVEIAKVQEFTQLYQDMMAKETREKLEIMMDKISKTQVVHPKMLHETLEEQRNILDKVEGLFKQLNHNIAQVALEFRIRARQNSITHNSRLDLNEQPRQDRNGSWKPGHSVVRAAYQARDKNCVSVTVGEFVRALAKPESGFLYVDKSDGTQGWIPLEVL